MAIEEIALAPGLPTVRTPRWGIPLAHHTTGEWCWARPADGGVPVWPGKGNWVIQTGSAARSTDFTWIFELLWAGRSRRLVTIGRVASDSGVIVHVDGVDPPPTLTPTEAIYRMVLNAHVSPDGALVFAAVIGNDLVRVTRKVD